MRTIFLALFFFLDMVLFGQGFNYMAPSIPSGGLVQTIDSTTSPDMVFVGTGNASVNLGSNSYSIQYQGTPAAGTNFICRFDASKLTAVAANVNIFGLTPLADFPGQGVYYIRYQVSGTRNNNKTVYTSYASSMIAPGGNVNTPTIFNKLVTFYDSVHLNNNLQILTGANVIALNDSGSLGYANCGAWYVCGNNSNPFPSFVGNIDTPDLRFRVGNIGSGFLSLNSLSAA